MSSMTFGIAETRESFLLRIPSCRGANIDPDNLVYRRILLPVDEKIPSFIERDAILYFAR